ncbi:MAG TPA: hypothetical protein PLU30_01700 [Verrucomicrobiae bacterium]|nr:hypothetical protein [Verrucomicrobiae bacterium]
MRLGKADVLREWLARRRALLAEECGVAADGRGTPEKRVSRRIERPRSVADGFSIMRVVNGALVE